MQIEFIDNIARYVAAGKAEFILEDHKYKRHFTYKVTRTKDGSKVWFVNVLVATDHESGYFYLGLIKGGNFFLTAKSFAEEETPCFVLFDMLFHYIRIRKDLPDWLEFHHEGRCARCGKKLTTPESIRVGLGPTCAKR